jgi:electron transport complex protein RnfC
MSRALFDFHGGIHPQEHKSISNQTPIVQVAIPPKLVLPLQQHIGHPSVPIVSVGDHVLKGQLIADPRGPVSVGLHAPTSGKVTAIEDYPVAHASGMSAPCILIEPDGEDTWCELEPCENYQQLSHADILHKIRQSGIAGMGGAGFPTEIKLHPPRQSKVATLILNGAECEPYITADDRLMQESADQIIQGMEIMAWLLSPGECVIAVEDNKPEAIAALKAASQHTGIEIATIPTKYPSGGEKQLIKILTGKEVPKGKIPADIGVMCQNVATAAAVYQAIRYGKPLISRITTLTGDGISQPGNYEVLIGAPIQWLLDQYGFKANQAHRVIMGGPMMGFTLQNLNASVQKTTNCLIAATFEELPLPPPPQACIRCGLCSEACPAELLPQQLYWFTRSEEFDKAEQHNLFDCIECGACSWVCPSAIPLVQYYRFGKGKIREKLAEQEKSNQARERFEARQARLEKEAREKEAKRKARAEAAAKAQALKKAKAEEAQPESDSLDKG